ncbi:TNFAIP3-interacting protein 1 isoform X2 [Eublepharis macularius]|uniref:TNFAIP3-interacting protein 1 n=1 Tax=Eublepharis macularius TaxID=481883 RepID=A0AA97KVE3_EUBMA|nr:TNFAIP3-interacting protein 1 isoform X2 [Eublepharis macularius]
MEGKGPYRIYDPGGGTQEEAAAAFDRLVEENTKLREKMQGIKSLGELLEQSQLEASRLRQKVENLVKDNEMLRSTSSLDKCTERTGGNPDLCCSPVVPEEDWKELEQNMQKPHSSGSSSEFEIVGAEDKKSSQESSKKSDVEPFHNEDSNLMLHLQRLESTLSLFAEESDKNQLFAHLGRMALEFNRLSSKVHKNEQRTSILQVRGLLALCEQLRNENEELRAKLEKELDQRNHASEKLKCENLELRKIVMMGSKEDMKGEGTENAEQQQKGTVLEKAAGKSSLGTSEKKVKILEHQRNELLEVNKQWDHHFRFMKQQYEQKVTELRQKLADSQKAVAELEAAREQKQRDFDRKLLLAKSKIEEEEAEKETYSTEVKDLKQQVKLLQDQLVPVTRQKEYQKEIVRLNKALEEALNVQASASPASNSPTESSLSIRQQEVMTQNELLKQQVKIFEEDFQRERSDRERMNEEKEELKQQLEKLQKQLMHTSNQLRISKEDCQKEKEEKDKFKKLLKQYKQHSGDRLHPEPQPGPVAPVYPMYQFPCIPPVPPHVYHGYEDWQQIRYPPSTIPNERPPVQNFHRFPPNIRGFPHASYHKIRIHKQWTVQNSSQRNLILQVLGCPKTKGPHNSVAMAGQHQKTTCDMHVNLHIQVASLCFWTQITVCVCGIYTLGTTAASPGFSEDMQHMRLKSGQWLRVLGNCWLRNLPVWLSPGILDQELAIAKEWPAANGGSTLYPTEPKYS